MSNKRQKGYWTREHCILAARKYSSVKQWIRNEGSGGYCAAHKNGWMDECTVHMANRKPIESFNPGMRRPRGYWTKERCISTAKKYTSIHQWIKAEHMGGYSAARINGWMGECITTRKIKPGHYWTKEKCQENALLYNNISEWAKNDGGAVNSATKNGWYAECTAHMTKLKKPNGYWTMERCLESAGKYNSVRDWRENEKSAYYVAGHKGWLKDCSEQIKELRNFY